MLLFATNCSEALIGAIGVRMFSDAPTRLDSVRRVLAFIGAAGLAAPILSSFADAAVVNELRGEPYWNVFRARMFANVLTELGVVPAILARRPRPVQPHRPQPAARRSRPSRSRWR